MDHVLLRVSYCYYYVSNLKNIVIFHHNVEHVNGAELGEILGEGDQVDRRPLVVLKEVRVAVVALPTEGGELHIERIVTSDHFISRRVDQDLTPGGAI